MPQGQVKWFDPKKGYGFIIGPDGQDVFVHYSHIQAEGFRALKDGEWVDYQLVKGEKGWQAREVYQGQGSGSGETNGTTTGGPSGSAEAPRSSGYEGADGRIG